MFTSPIIYPSSIVPDVWRTVYGLNPMVAVVEAARSAFAGGPLPGSATLLPAFAVSITSLLAGHRYFRLREAQLADVV